MAYSVSSMQDDCYPGTSTLINKLDIRNQTQLDENEALIVGIKSLQFEQAPFEAPLDFAYYRRLHKFLFEQLYSWAGELRTVNLSKQHTHFCSADELANLASHAFVRLTQLNYFRVLSRKQLVTELSDFYQTINYLHPFREGNGRTQRLYFRQLARLAGYHLNFAAVDSDDMMLATIHAASGIMDGLHQVFEEILTVSH